MHEPVYSGELEDLARPAADHNNLARLGPPTCGPSLVDELRVRIDMTTWHQVRRIIAGVVAGVAACGGERAGLPLGWAIAVGVAAAIIAASLLLPLLWKPPKQ